MTDAHPKPQILTIQSAVMYGVVGNDAAMRVYHHHKIAAARLDTARLAAHPGYNTQFCDISVASALTRLLDDTAQLAAFSKLKLVQTGYFGAADQTATIRDFLNTHYSEEKRPLYLLDPVLGDGGRLYVDDDLPTAIKRNLLPLADYITPNLFELELLTGRKLATDHEVIDAAQSLLSGRLKAVLVTGTLGTEAMAADILVMPDMIRKYPHPLRQTGIAGAGDILSALLICGLLAGQPIKDAAEIASTSLSEMIATTQSPLGIDLDSWFWAHPPYTF